MARPTWQDVWNQFSHRQRMQALHLGLALVAGGIVVAMVAAVLLISGVTRLVEVLRQYDSPYPGMSDRQFSRCVELSEQTLEARLAVARLGTNPASGVATDAALSRVETLAVDYRQDCSAQRWRAVFEAARNNGLPAAERPEDWLALVRR
ncbi:hypothetical protein [Pseudomonas citronellolis]|uniref:hypothetical protein n=1 Tax=Pseudomonas citronellolis TaxID=53408 RepID=UPI0023E3F1EE|nr:hypothetical protein [Pseudomonas citronellolis]MDF3933073.1 hypothetical protein [Pseudomonas citronellolis]